MRLPLSLSLTIGVWALAAPVAAQIYAGQTPGGGVVLFTQAGNVPLNVGFDDSMAISPTARLSARIAIAANVCGTSIGSALARTGALQGHSTAVAPDAQNPKIEIDEEFWR